MTLDANNRINNGIETYDAAGNMLTDGFHTYTYDAENRITCVDNGAAVYQYDAEGRRLRKITGASSCGATTGGTIVDYLYDLAGRPVTKWCAKCSWGSGWDEGDVWAAGMHLATYSEGTLFFNHSDWLGTERARTQNNGASCETITSLPFGDGMAYAGSCSDTSPLHFTGKERDGESNLDYFGARYNSSSLGRFMSPDPSNVSVDFWLPQTWNRYPYTLDNPLTMVDQNGLWPTYVHDLIIEHAFPGLGSQETDLLEEASSIVDLNQDPAASFEHGGMTDGLTGQTAAEAQQLEDDFIDQNEHNAQQLQADWEASGHTGICPAALTAFGNAMHAVTDAKSPTHRGNQPWYGLKGTRNKARAAWHLLREAVPTPSAFHASVQAARSAWVQTFGHEFDQMVFEQSIATKKPAPEKPCTWNRQTSTLNCPD